METELERLRRENIAFRAALTPSAHTKYIHNGEYQFDEISLQLDEYDNEQEVSIKKTVPWTTIKEIMAAIRTNAGVIL